MPHLGCAAWYPSDDGRPARALPRQARLRGHAGAVRRRPPRRRRAAPARFVVQEHHARAPALGPAARARRRARVVGGAEGHPGGPRRATTSRCGPRTTRSTTSTSRATIPEGEYGAGTMTVWDRGTYETHKFRDEEVMVTFHGERLQGRYVLFRTRGNDWMIHRMDPPADPGTRRLPERLEPMLARPARCPPRTAAGRTRSSGTACGPSARVSGGRLRLASRNGRDITPRYPELRALGRGARGARGRARRRGGRLRRGRPAELPAPAEAHAPDLRARRAPAGAQRCPSSTSSSTCSTSTAARCSSCPTPSAARALEGSG